MLTVAAVARRLGVAPATLRTWDRRYGLGPSEHQAGAHRRYSAADVARLLVMRRLTLDGVAPADAAAIAREAPAADASSVTVLAPRSSLNPRENPNLTPHPQQVSSAQPDPPRSPPAVAAGAPHLVEVGAGERAVRGLSRAALALDADECRRIIRRHIDREGVVATWEKVISPVLTQVGDRWESSGDGIEVEHLLSECVIDGMRAVSASYRPPGVATARDSASPVVLATAEHEQHGLPLHVLAAALVERGVPVRLFGVRVPRVALAAAVRRLGPSVVLVYAHIGVEDIANITELPRLRPAPLILLGGPGWHTVATPPGVERVADLRGSVERIERALGR